MVGLLKGKALFDRLMEQKDDLDAFMARVIRFAYQYPLLILNPVISRNPFSNSLQLRMAQQWTGPRGILRVKTLLFNLIKYYFKTVSQLVLYFFYYLAFKASRLRFKPPQTRPGEELIVINTFTMIDRILPSGRFDDTYFGNLYSIMQKTQRPFVVLCLLFGSQYWKISNWVKTYNIFADDGRNFITEFDLIKWNDWISLLYSCLVYPLSVRKLFRRQFGLFDAPFRDEVLATLDQPQVFNLLRYYIGRRLHIVCSEPIMLISWYENQVIDKMLHKGIHDSGKSIETIGCQFFIKFPLYISLQPLPEEKVFGVLPKLILVNGQHYLSSNPDLNTKLGFSPRYNYLFNSKHFAYKVKNNTLLILLPYEIPLAKYIIELIRHLDSALSMKTTVKLHPNHLLSKPYTLPEHWEYTTAPLEDILTNFEMVITSGSSTAAEAAAIGCSVVIIASETRLTLNPMPPYGQGLIWNIAFDNRDLLFKVEELRKVRRDDPDKVMKSSRIIRDNCFVEANEEKYFELFGI